MRTPFPGFCRNRAAALVDIKQFGERPEGHFFMRVDFAAEGDASTGRPGPP